MTFSAGFESKSVISFRYVFYNYHIVHRIAVLSFHFHADPPFVLAVFLSSVKTDCVSRWLLKLCFSHNCIGTKADAFRLRQRWMLQSYFCSRVKNHLHWIIRSKMALQMFGVVKDSLEMLSKHKENLWAFILILFRMKRVIVRCVNIVNYGFMMEWNNNYTNRKQLYF